MVALSPDDFLLDQLDLHPAGVIDGLHRQVDRYSVVHGPVDVTGLLAPLARAGVPRFAGEVRRHLL